MFDKTKDTPYFPGFQAYFVGRPNVSRKESLKRETEKIKATQMMEFRMLFTPFLPTSIFSSSFGKKFTRNRVYTLEVLFFGFLNQVILNGMSCCESVTRIQTWMISKGQKPPSSATGAYCKAKKKISLSFINKIFTHTVEKLRSMESENQLWHGRVVKVVDGSGLSMPDTKENQKVYPQNGAMEKGCGFPQLNIVALFSLFSGALLGYETGDKHRSENRLWKKLSNLLNPGDVVLGDRGYYSYANTASLFSRKIDSVVRLCTGRPGDLVKLKSLGQGDRLCVWHKPKSNSSSLWSKDELMAMPSSILVRVVEAPLIRKGFRTQKLTILTTLLDEIEFSAEELAKLYFKRWAIELRFKDIKTTMGMDILKSKTPRQVQKEIAMFAIGYNLIRGMMMDAAKRCCKEIDEISFAGARHQLSQWTWLFLASNGSISEIRILLDKFYHSITCRKVPDRPGRNEPRAKKRRPKNYRLMNKPRKKMVVDSHRNNPKRKNAFNSLK